jgi:prophage DNA circulation protein
MQKADAEEAAPIARLTMEAILAVTTGQGRPGADLRTAIGDFNAHALALIQGDQSGPPLAAIFELTRKNGATLPQMALVRAAAASQTPATVGATLIKNSIINLSLSIEARIIADTEFNSRQAAEDMKDAMSEAFDAMEEIAADDMDVMTYSALVALHAALVEHLITAERPLPHMLNFQFNEAGPTLVFAYRLYADAGRADQLREENGIIHPLFAPPFGRALSS